MQNKTVTLRLSAHNFERLFYVAEILGQTPEQLLNGEVLNTALQQPESCLPGSLLSGARKPSRKESKQWTELTAIGNIEWAPQEIGADAGPVPNVYLTPGNLARLKAVGLALECDPTSLLNNFLCEDLVAPSHISGGMDFTEGGKLTKAAAKKRERSVTAASEAMDDDGWKITHYLP